MAIGLTKWAYCFLLVVSGAALNSVSKTTDPSIREIEPLFSALKPPKMIADPDYTSQTLGIRPVEPIPAEAHSNTQLNPGISYPSKTTVKDPQDQNNASTPSSPFQGAPFVSVNANKNTSDSEKKSQKTKNKVSGEKEADIFQPSVQFFGKVEDYDATSFVLGKKENRFEKKAPKAESSKQPSSTANQPQQKSRPFAGAQAKKVEEFSSMSSQPPKQAQQSKPIDENQQKKPAKTESKELPKPNEHSQPKPTQLPTAKSTSELKQPSKPKVAEPVKQPKKPIALERQVPIVPTYQYFGDVVQQYDATSAIIGGVNPRFAKVNKTQQNKTQQNKPSVPSTTIRKPLFPQIQRQKQKQLVSKKPQVPTTTTTQPTVVPVQQPSEPPKPKPVRTKPTSSLPEVIDTRKSSTSATTPPSEDIEGEKSLILKLCSIVIVGIAILKLIQWRKSQTANSEYYDRNEPEGEFTGMGQETALELDTDTKDEDNQES